MLLLVGVVTAVTSLRVGAVVSIVKELTGRLSLAMPLKSGDVTLTVQSLYVSSGRALKVIVLLFSSASVVELLQLPP